MSITTLLTHASVYEYSRPVVMGPQVVRLRPAPHCRTTVLGYSLRVEGGEHYLNWQQDPFGNWEARLVFPEPITRLAVTVAVTAELVVINPFEFFLEADAQEIPFTYSPGLRADLSSYLRTEALGPLQKRFLAGIDRTPRDTIKFLVALNQRLFTEIRYLIRMEPGVQSPEETLTLGSGSCRDSAWLLANILRHLGLATRFASGYLVQLTADEKSLDGPSGPEKDFTDLHAWCEVYLPGAGWVGLDPTSGLFAGEGHLPLACTPEPSSAAPISGGFAPVSGEDDVECAFSVAMSVQRVAEPPRTTAPYTEAQWERILVTGDMVEKRLAADAVRLTMGGEPTFISIDDPDGEEWATEALGTRKRQLAGQLVKRLRTRFATGALLHYGQGKWYPGEQLPRWALTCHWRRDGHALWRDDALIADIDKPTGANASLSERFIAGLSTALGVDGRHVLPSVEDAFYYLWRERQLPVNVDPYASKLGDELERKRLTRIFSQGLDATVGHVLPIRGLGGGRFVSGRWILRDERLRLLPGDSSMGYRLPLDSLPWELPSQRWQDPLPDPMAPAKTLAAKIRPQPTGKGSAEPVSDPNKQIVRSALCVEPRAGHLHLFMPPLTDLEDYLAVITAAEDTARSLGTPLVIEGYTPPRDARLNQFSVTPDPGVIEVNVHPAHSWRESVDITTGVYEEARACRLTSERFALDGQQTGTGGGNHVTLGGSTPADSPFLRRPDLLASLITHWHNHPSLSYMFSGQFIGPTSQAPRADEARSETTYELQTALRRLERTGAPTPPWLVDRTLRHLLVDLTGNTHRAEFSIDKMFSPDSASGRLGLLELRGFEMPPHTRMALAQQLLVRSLVARAWRAPITTPLVRWGTLLHDRWMLPEYNRLDFQDVLADLAAHGLAMDQSWFAPHQEFRFPLLGSTSYRGIELELRRALEPWHVLGEEAAGGGNARYVDSSLERVQVLVRGLSDSRHQVLANGIPVPLHPTGTLGEAVAGVRFRAWQPPSCLHPDIPVHAPLVFDLFDSWTGRAVAGCTYYVAHPGGRAHERRPVNAYAAEGRRIARFQAQGHSPGPMTVTEARPDADYPHTLDLRRSRR